MNSTEALLAGALEIAAAGYKVFPIGANKAPSCEGGHYAATDNPEKIREWAENGQLKNVAIATGAVSGVCVTDADTEEAAERLRAQYGDPHVETTRGGHWYWAHPGRKVTSKPLGGGVDSKADGGYVLAPPSTGKSWVDGIPTELPEMPEELMPSSAAVNVESVAIPEDRFEAAVKVLAAHYPEPGDRYEAGKHLSGYLQGNGVSEEDSYNLMLEALSRRGEVDKSAAYNIGRVTSTTAQRLAGGEHVTGGPSLEEYVPGLPRKIADALEWSDKLYELTDAGNAERFVDTRGHNFRYVREWKSWARWDGRRWVECDVGPVMWGMIATVREIYAEAARAKDQETADMLSSFAKASQNGSRVDFAIKQARGLLGVNVEDLDQDPMLLNVENGTIDLRTGEVRPHNRDDLITKLVPTAFDPKAKAPRFRKFLKQVLVDDDLIAFVQRFLGYSLTGSVEERALGVLHGIGKNGKSTLVELFHDMLGDYAATTSPETIMQQKYGGTKDYHLAELVGVRFLAVAETKRGSQLDEATVKMITGGDTISARPIYGKPITYRPQFKIWLSTNHRPEIPDGSEAIWDRLRLMPFRQRFDGKKEDKSLPAKLREEFPGVLAWAVEGCVEWREAGLGSAKAVEKATAEYRAETDVLDRFFEDVCEFGPELTVTRKALFEAWERWCDEEGAAAGVQADFTPLVRERGVVKNFAEAKVKGTRLWKGIGIAHHTPPDDTPAPPQNACKQRGGERSGGQQGQVFQELSDLSSREETFEKTGVSCPPAPHEVSPPLSWEIDGVTTEYVLAYTPASEERE